MVCIDQEVTYGPRCTHKNTICGPLKNKQGHLHEKMKKSWIQDWLLRSNEPDQYCRQNQLNVSGYYIANSQKNADEKRSKYQ